MVPARWRAARCALRCHCAVLGLPCSCVRKFAQPRITRAGSLDAGAQGRYQKKGAPLNGLLTHLARFEQFRPILGYAVAGAAGVCVYGIVLSALVHMHVPAIVSFTVSWGCGIALQFLMNRYWSFRAFDRPIRRQVVEYVAIALLNYVLMLAIEEFGMRVLNLSALAAFGLTIPVNTPIAYLANRHLTFRRASTDRL